MGREVKPQIKSMKDSASYAAGDDFTVNQIDPRITDMFLKAVEKLTDPAAAQVNLRDLLATVYALNLQAMEKIANNRDLIRNNTARIVVLEDWRGQHSKSVDFWRQWGGSIISAIIVGIIMLIARNFIPVQ